MATTVTLTRLCMAVADTLRTAQGLNSTQTLDQIHESRNNTPELIVYAQNWAGDSDGTTERRTFQAGVRTAPITIHADLYAAQRAHLGQEMKLVMELADAINSVLEAQKTKPYFGDQAIKGFSWTAERATFVEGDEQTGVKYSGVRWTLELTVF